MPNEPREPAVTDFDVLRTHRGDRFYREGETRTAKEADVLHLIRNGTLRASTALKSDGPTVGEFVAAGYKASNYPPSGYASRSTADEIAAAIAAEATPPAAATVTAPKDDPAAVSSDSPPSSGASEPLATETEPMAAAEKGAQAPDNKAAPKPDNKAAPKPSNKSAS